jgi:hypothetical protein
MLGVAPESLITAWPAIHRLGSPIGFRQLAHEGSTLPLCIGPKTFMGKNRDTSGP